VEVMILHAASMTALFVDQVTQAPAVVQCVLPANADPGLKQWIQPILNLVSILAVVGIAIFSFGATSRKEHRRWLLDQKKAEWKELIKTASEIESVIPLTLRIQEGYDSASMFLPQKIAQLSGIRESCLFLGDILHRKENLDAFSEFTTLAALVSENLQGFNSQTETNPDVRQLNRTQYKGIHDAYLKFCSHLRTEAQRDLGGK
jgi:hypothetical protein